MLAKELKQALAKTPDEAEINLILGDRRLSLLYDGPLDVVCGKDGVIYLKGNVLRAKTGLICEPGVIQ